MVIQLVLQSIYIEQRGGHSVGPAVNLHWTKRQSFSWSCSQFTLSKEAVIQLVLQSIYIEQRGSHSVGPAVNLHWTKRWSFSWSCSQFTLNKEAVIQLVLQSIYIGPTVTLSGHPWSSIKCINHMVTHSGYSSRWPNHPLYILTEWSCNQVTQPDDLTSHTHLLKQAPIQSPSQSLDPVTQPGRIHWLKQKVDQITQSATRPDSLYHLPMVTHQPDDLDVHLANQANQDN